jgi:two-component system, cell cycle sensor histidine kinase and response regulator CckA
VVDDESQVRAIVRRLLEADNWKIVEAADGAEALRLISTVSPVSLLITDVRMPGMNGMELAAEVRHRGHRIPVLYLTGFADALFVSRAVLRDGEAFLTKPFTRTGLLQAVRDVMAIEPAPAEDPASDAFHFPDWWTRRGRRRA